MARIAVSRFARWYIRLRGGTLYVWSSAIAGDSDVAFIRSSTRRQPPDVQFDLVRCDEVTLWFQKGLLADAVVSIGWSLFSGGIDVTWPGTIDTFTFGGG